MFYYAGFNANTLFSDSGDIVYIVDSFTEVAFPGITDFQIGWGYFLLWKGRELHICKKDQQGNTGIQLIQIPENPLDSCKSAAIGKDNIIILSNNNDLWRYQIYEAGNAWKKVTNFIPSNDDSDKEYPVKVLQGGCTVVLTNLGRVFNVPTLVEMPKRVKFVDVACGFDHTILLAESGDVYSMGMGTRGQLGHNDLEDCDNPKLIEALAGLKVVQISAMGWHSAVITDQGDLYTWGWNTNGELGFPSLDSKVVAVPTLVDFTDDQNEVVETFVKKVECGNTFTVCLTGTCLLWQTPRDGTTLKNFIFLADDGTFWGCGCNKYGQLGQSREDLSGSTKFIKLQIPKIIGSIKDFSCREWGTVLSTQ
ncbi:RCC1 domain-containing protein 1 isoform X1 [Halictus rubicundus]|uniref:RCC1 domain-containing protein 1 isoform X1 n=1 Tax=Halictus rubicundus TaxID=77578 RepID=UPI00403593A9